MSELEVFNSLKEKFPDAELETNGNFVNFSISIGEFLNTYHYEKSVIKYALTHGEEVFEDGKLWKFKQSSEDFLYTSFDRTKLKLPYPEVREKSTEDEELKELINTLDSWIGGAEVSEEHIRKVLWALAMSKQDQLLTKVLRNIRSSQE